MQPLVVIVGSIQLPTAAYVVVDSAIAIKSSRHLLQGVPCVPCIVPSRESRLAAAAEGCIQTADKMGREVLLGLSSHC